MRNPHWCQRNCRGSQESGGGGYFKACTRPAIAPASSILNYPAATTITLAILPRSLPRALTVFNHGGPTYIVIDVTGYYQTQISADILGSGDSSATHPGPVGDPHRRHRAALRGRR